MQQLLSFEEKKIITRLKFQLLKWIGNKQRFAHKIISYFPDTFNTYYEPFLGSGAVLATLAPKRAVASDIYKPLMQIWFSLHNNPKELKKWYLERYHRFFSEGKVKVYEEIKASFNNNPNGGDLIFLCRACYGGVIRFRKSDGYMSTPPGIHSPISPESFAKRVDEWHYRTQNTLFKLTDYKEIMLKASEGDLIYCDPPYLHSQGILYGAQEFDIKELFSIIEKCKARGVFVVLSIDGKKRSGTKICELPMPTNLFKREVFVNCGPSMLKRFQMEGKTLENYVVADRLLLTY